VCQTEDAPILCLCRNLQRQLALGGWHLDLPTQYRHCQRYRDINMQIIAVALKVRVRPDRGSQIKVTAGAAAIAGLSLTGDTHPGAIVHSVRDFYLKSLHPGHRTTAATG